MNHSNSSQEAHTTTSCTRIHTIKIQTEHTCSQSQYESKSGLGAPRGDSPFPKPTPS
jgi:hypothetical protein